MVLIVEPDRFVADYVRAVLRSAAADVIDPVSSIQEARQLVSSGLEPCAVVLSADLSSADGHAWAEVLTSEGVAFVFTRARPEPAPRALPTGSIMLSWPFAAHQVRQAIIDLVEGLSPPA
jgi:DNA-binding response OmpR family regulator